MYNKIECVIDGIESVYPMPKSTKDFRSYLTNRIDDIWYKGKTALAKKFNLLEDDTPLTAKAFVERIQSGKYQLPEKDEETGLTSYGMGPYGIIWRDPANVADPVGFEAAVKLLRDAKTEALDVVKVLDETKSLDALTTLKDYVKSLN